MGSFSYRKSPSPDEVTEPLVEVAVAEDTCPGCGGRLEHEGVRVVYATDIPPVPRPQVTGYRVQICRCRSCGKQVPRAASRCCAGPVRGQRAPGRETSDGGGPRAPLWSGRSGTEGPRCAQSADWCGTEPRGRSAKTRCDVPGVQWGMPTISCGVRCVPVHSSTPTTRDGEWTAGLLF